MWTNWVRLHAVIVHWLTAPHSCQTLHVCRDQRFFLLYLCGPSRLTANFTNRLLEGGAWQATCVHHTEPGEQLLCPMEVEMSACGGDHCQRTYTMHARSGVLAGIGSGRAGRVEVMPLVLRTHPQR